MIPAYPALPGVAGWVGGRLAGQGGGPYVSTNAFNRSRPNS